MSNNIGISIIDNTPKEIIEISLSNIKINFTQIFEIKKEK